jgi:sugar phosphate isomerase/epimerase
VSRPSFAVSTHLYHNERLDRDHLVEIAAHGFESIELFANRPHFAYEDPAALAALAEALEDAGLQLHSIHAPIAGALKAGRWTGAYSLASAHEAARAAAVVEAKKALELARLVPARYLVVHAGVPDGQAPSPDENRRDAAQRSLEELHDAAEPLGVRLAVEVMPNSLSSAEGLAAWIEDELDLTTGIGICFDLGHAHLMGDVVDAIEAASGHITTTHVHDNRGTEDEHRLPFEGNLPWDAALMALRKVGYEGAMVFELAGSDVPKQVLERAQRVRTRLESMLTL